MIVVDGFFFFKQKTAYEMRISDWSSDVCSSDLQAASGSDEVRFSDNGIALGPDGTIYFTESATDGLYMKQPGGTVVQLASEDEVAADIGESDVELEGLVFEPDGFLYVIDGSSNSLLSVDPDPGKAQVWVAEGTFAALQGLDDFGPNGGT